MAINLKAWKGVDGEVVYIQESQPGEVVLGANYTRMPGLDRVVSNDFNTFEDFATQTDLTSTDTALTAETAARIAGDNALQSQITSNDSDITSLQNQIDTHEQSIDNHDDVDVTTSAPTNTNILRYDGSNWIPSREKQFTQLSGRFEIDQDSDWACWSDPNFGPSLLDWDLDLADSGPGGIPAVDWDGIGLLFPAGATLNRIFVKVRGNSNDIDSIQTYVRAHDVDLLAGNAIDSTGEIGAVEVDGIRTFDLDSGAGSANDVRGFEIPLNDYTFTNAGDLHLMMKAVNGSLTGNRQLRCTIFIEWELPL